MNTIICFSGGIGSGKSSVSNEIAKKLNWKKTGFGDYLRQYAEDENIVVTREKLQELGVQKISQGWESFCKEVLEYGGWKKGENLVIDGIRHIEAIENIKELTSPGILKLFYLNLEINKRIERSSEISDTSELQKYEKHSTELQVKSVLLKQADLVLDSNLPVPVIILQILKHLQI